jgi:type VI secretion system protein ImpH
MPDILSQLLHAPHTFNLFQAINLLERAAPDRAPAGTSVGKDEAVGLAAHVSLAFAPSDIASIKPNAGTGPAWTLRTPAMTLAGAQGPLAMPFTELLLEQRSAKNPAGLDFLDIFNGRLIGFRHRARARQHVALHAGDIATAPLLRTIDALSGLGRTQGAQGPAGEQGWLRHASLQNAAPRSMASLLALLRDRFNVPFTGEQFVGGWHPLALRERARLDGKKGLNTSLGARAWDQAAGIALAAPPLNAVQFAQLLPGSPRFGLLGWLVARHLQADFTVTLTLTLAEAPASRLRTGARLGRNAWLCSRAATGAAYRPARLKLAAPQVSLAKAA